jgi:hypothetical protein
MPRSTKPKPEQTTIGGIPVSDLPKSGTTRKRLPMAEQIRRDADALESKRRRAINALDTRFDDLIAELVGLRGEAGELKYELMVSHIDRILVARNPPNNAVAGQ